MRWILILEPERVHRREMWYAPHHQSDHRLISLVTEVDSIDDRVVKVQFIEYTETEEKGHPYRGEEG